MLKINNKKKEAKMGFFEIKRKMIELVYKLKTISNKSKEYIKTRNELRSLKKNNQLAWLEIQ